MRTRRTARRGVALMLVLWLIVVLGGIAAAVTTGARNTSQIAINSRARVAARYAAESGVVAAVQALQRGMDRAGDDVTKRRALLNNARQALGDAATFELGDVSVRVVLIDVSARVDVNAAPVEVLAALFARTGFGRQASTAARAIRAHIDAVPGQAQLFRSLDDVAAIPEVGEKLIAATARYLTVDGDGQVNRVTAPPVVLGVARGSLIEEPSRVLLVARGWQRGHPITHEIQAVYAIQGNQLAFVRWRERDL
jgi:type II secretory pathway component PulK